MVVFILVWAVRKSGGDGAVLPVAGLAAGVGEGDDLDAAIPLAVDEGKGEDFDADFAELAIEAAEELWRVGALVTAASTWLRNRSPRLGSRSS
jgi:hypothetical protein